MASNNCDVFVGRIGAFKLRDEAGGTNNIKSGNTKKALGVVNPLRFEDLRAYRDRGVNLQQLSVRRDRKRHSQFLTGLEITRILASGAASATAFARSRTIDALVLKRSVQRSVYFETTAVLLVYRHESFQLFEGRQRG